MLRAVFRIQGDIIGNENAQIEVAWKRSTMGQSLYEYADGIVHELKSYRWEDGGSIKNLSFLFCNYERLSFICPHIGYGSFKPGKEFSFYSDLPVGSDPVHRL